jgi:hypothetical protein
VPELFFKHAWIGIPFWALLYISDYTLTLICARMYQSGVRDKIAFEGSYELTPYFQRDIDSLRVISPKFVAALLTISILLTILWWLAQLSTPAIFLFVLGAFICSQLCVHIRHIRNYYMFKAASTDAVRGRIEYSRPLSLRVSSIEMLSFSGLFLILYLSTGSFFILGGVVSLITIATKHSKLARGYVSPSVPKSKQIAASEIG